MSDVRIGPATSKVAFGQRSGHEFLCGAKLAFLRIHKGWVKHHVVGAGTSLGRVTAKPHHHIPLFYSVLSYSIGHQQCL